MKIKTVRVNKIAKKPEVEEGTGAILLKSAQRLNVPGSTVKIFKTGIAMEIPEDHYGLILDPLTIKLNYPLMVRSKTITNSDREEIEISVENTTNYPELIMEQQVIAKVLILPIVKTEVQLVSKLSKVEK